MGDLIDQSPLKVAGDRRLPIISILALQDVAEDVRICMSQAAEIAILVVISKSNVLTTRTSLVINLSTHLRFPTKRQRSIAI
jgi:hypothetical protein